MKTKLADVSTLKPHPQNYRTHPAKQLKHLAASIRQHGIIRPVVVANDGVTVLAGHGLVEAARLEGVARVPVLVTRYAVDSPQAQHLMVADNEPFNLGHADPQSLLDLLAVLKEADMLGGTGLDAWPPDWEGAGSPEPAPAAAAPATGTAAPTAPGVTVKVVCDSSSTAERVRVLLADVPGVTVKGKSAADTL